MQSIPERTRHVKVFRRGPNGYIGYGPYPIHPGISRGAVLEVPGVPDIPNIAYPAYPTYPVVPRGPQIPGIPGNIFVSLVFLIWFCLFLAAIPLKGSNLHPRNTDS